MTIYSLGVLFSQFGISQLFLLLLDLYNLEQISQEAGKVFWYSLLFKNFPQIVVIYTVKCFGILNKAEVGVFFLELSCFSYDAMDVGNLISGSSAFSKSYLYIWKSSVHVLLKTSLEDFEHYLASM